MNINFVNNSALDGIVSIGNGNSLNAYPSNTLINCTFLNNVSKRAGGAVKVGNFCSVEIQDSTFRNNSVETLFGENRGGAIFSTGKMAIHNSTFLNNKADQGGAIWSSGYFDSPDMTITRSYFSGNQAQIGAGLFSGVSNGFSNRVEISNSTFSRNTAVFSGGGIMFQGSSVQQTLTNVTIAGNRADDAILGSGAGISLSQGNPNVRIFNSLVIGNLSKSSTNTPSDLDGMLHDSSAYNLVGDSGTSAGLVNGSNSNIVGIDGSGTRPVDSVIDLTPLGYGNNKSHAPIQKSLALNRGSANVPGYVAYDQSETPRGSNSVDAPDIGSYEIQHPLTPVGVPQTYDRTFQPKPSTSTNEAFIKGLHLSGVFYKGGTGSAGVVFWLNIMNSGTQTIQQIAYNFLNSDENRNRQLTSFYRYFLRREPDIAGMNGWLAQLKSGVDESVVMNGFILSAEYSASNTNAQFVDTMYYAILGRQADTAGFNGWVNALNGGMTRQTVVNAFVRSSEGITRIVNSYFAAYLKRPATTAELNKFNGLANSQTFGFTASQILGSQEFLTAAGQYLS